MSVQSFGLQKAVYEAAWFCIQRKLYFYSIEEENVESKTSCGCNDSPVVSG